MTESAVPADIARETLRYLVSQHLPPTPENYARMYYQVIQQKDLPVNGSEAEALETVTRENFSLQLDKECQKLVENDPTNPLIDLFSTMSVALKRAELSDFYKVCEHFFNKKSIDFQESSQLNWASLIKRLLEIYLFPHHSLTPSIKREMLDQALSPSDIKVVYRRLVQLIHEWESESRKNEQGGRLPTAQTSGQFSQTVTSVLRELFGDTLRTLAANEGSHSPFLIEKADSLNYLIGTVDNLDAFEVIRRELKDFCFRAALDSTQSLEIQEGLVRIIETVLSGLDALIAYDEKLKKRLEEAREALREPLDYRKLDLADRILTAIMIHQVEGNEALQCAHQDLKKLLFRFIDYLSEATNATGNYQDKIHHLAKNLEQTSDMTQMSSIFSSILAETNQARIQLVKTHEKLHAAQRAVQQTEMRITILEEDIAKASELALLDPTTGVLNRRGIDERLNKEIRRARRKCKPLCLAAIDIDNFRQFVAQFGHKAGDEALKSLVESVLEHLRKRDIIARYSGEEFIIIYPDTDLEAAGEVTTILQRQLTKRFFLNEEEHILITFSAGVTQLRGTDTDETLIERAIKLMFLAKEQGKNRVITSDIPASI